MTEGHAGEPTAVCALEEVLLSAEGCVRLAAQRLGGADPLRGVLEDLLRALEPIGTEVRGTQDAPAEGGIRDWRSAHGILARPRVRRGGRRPRIKTAGRSARRS